MEVILDNKPLRPQPTLAAALRSGVDEAARAGRVVVEALLDGAAIADDVLERPPEEAIGSELRLTSVEPRALVRVTLMDASDALERAAEEQRHCGELIQSGRVEEAMAPLSSALQTWQTVRDAVEKCAGLLPGPLNDLEFPGGARGSDRLIALISSLTRHLEEVKRALGTEDWSALADVVAYDLTDEAQRWRSLLDAISGGLRQGD